jgi:hypothetical protein
LFVLIDSNIPNGMENANKFQLKYIAVSFTLLSRFLHVTFQCPVCYCPVSCRLLSSILYVTFQYPVCYFPVSCMLLSSVLYVTLQRLQVTLTVTNACVFHANLIHEPFELKLQISSHLTRRNKHQTQLTLPALTVPNQ